MWFTGLSASGKSTLACALELALLEQGKRAFRLDGDNVRFGLNKDLGFSPEDRTENIRRVGEVRRAALWFALAGMPRGCCGRAGQRRWRRHSVAPGPYRHSRDHILATR